MTAIFKRVPRAPISVTASVTSIAVSLVPIAAWAQEPAGPPDAAAPLPPIEVTQPNAAKKKAANKAKPSPAASNEAAAPVAEGAALAEPMPPAASGSDDGQAPVSPVLPGTRSGSLGVPTAAEARAEIERTPGGVDVVDGDEYQSNTPAVTIKDALDYVPGVFVQPKWGEDSRLSIRGSGLSRNFHLRGLQLYMDGIPINTADGFGDFQEIDPSAYRYIEVFKGGNALRFGSNSLGGAINFVMPTGYDAALFGGRVDVGSFGFRKVSASSGAVSGAADYFISGTWQEQDGFRDHSDGESVRGTMNIGYRLTDDIETRFYLNANSIDQRIPGSVTKEQALTDPTTAQGINVLNDWQRNVDSVRVANKTTFRIAPGSFVEFGGFYVDRHLMHPIFLWLDYQYEDYGGFARVTADTEVAGFRNRLVAGGNVHNGEVDSRLYGIGPGAARGPLFVRTIDSSENVSAYIENSFYVMPQIALVAGTQFLHAVRDRSNVQGDASGESEFDLWSPKAGVLWDVTPTAQVFANVSRSAEVPSFGENTPIFGQPFNAKAQRATTYEIGTRGRTEDFTWDLALYRADIDDELLCMAPFPVADFCIVANADETIHQGIEAGIGAAIFKGLMVGGSESDKVWLNAAYTFSDFRYDDDALFGNNEIPGAPRHFLRAEVLYKHPSGVYFGPNVEWVPDAYYIDSANTLDTEAYAIWGAKLGYETEKFAAYVEGRNLADEAYIASTGITNVADPDRSAFFEPGNGRAVYGGVQVKW
ncbi:MAG: TonB-dependent receptor [Hyphomicrobium sp.]|nr:TonB-dependent receptor [Hyphomicrobium sp.]